MINSREKGKLRLPLRKEEILGQIDTTITDREGIMQSRQCQIAIKWSEQYSENQCIKYWKKSRTSPFSNGPTRWWEIPKRVIETSIVNTIKTMVIRLRIVEVYGTTWTNLSEKVN